MPHIWLERAGQRISTLDLLDGRFVLLTGDNGAQWCEAAAETNASLGINFIAAYRIGEGGDLKNPKLDWAQRMGVSLDGSVLIRPDGFVAWRSHQLASTPQPLEQVLGQILCRSTPIGTPRSAKQAVSG